ncbi:hypothetical protein, partial [Salmonella enterica]|uniref:hypothetical protein n=1 Tax=Salmonella enterica TaxID=28901 RepID=UPI001F3E014C
LAFSRFNFDQSSSILNACCIYHWVLEDKYETDKIHPSRIISQKLERAAFNAGRPGGYGCFYAGWL